MLTAVAGQAPWIGGSSNAISDISTKSRSRILLATFSGRTAAGLYGPRLDNAGTGTVWPCDEDLGMCPDPARAEEATDTSRCSPAVLPGSGLNVGKVGGR